ncbi:immunity 53 family protein [Pararhizobium capsulatum]|uniref:immunity 53 family protein n=1 Tax=Pararhizobium capsulatum TaxID=34014 RepID=UPI0027D7E1D6|nr:immunity 53 family protein [Pararhizobium capsulatum]
MDALDFLVSWYNAQCNGDWEHDFGFEIGTLDNPGFTLKVDLKGSALDGKTLDRISHSLEAEQDWWACWTEDNSFRGVGGPENLRSLLEAFRDWVRSLS